MRMAHLLGSVTVYAGQRSSILMRISSALAMASEMAHSREGHGLLPISFSLRFHTSNLGLGLLQIHGRQLFVSREHPREIIAKRLL